MSIYNVLPHSNTQKVIVIVSQLQLLSLGKTTVR